MLRFRTFAWGIQPEGQVKRTSKPSTSTASDVAGGFTVGNEPVTSLMNEGSDFQTVASGYGVLLDSWYDRLWDLV